MALINKTNSKTTAATNSNPMSGKQKKEIRQKLSIPKTVQDSIPYEAIYKNGIIETAPNYFTKSYLLGDANFSLSSQEEQTFIFSRYEEFLNMFAPGAHFQVSIFNRKIDEQKVEDEVLLKFRRDGLDEYREEMNEILKEKIAEGQNNLVKEKYLTVGCRCEDIESATNMFNRLDAEIATVLKPICNREIVPMSIEDRLNLLYDIYNMDTPVPFNAKATINGQEAKFFTLDLLRKYGITSKDLIGPESMQFQKDYCLLGDKYVRILYVETYPSFLSTDFLANVTDTTFNMLTSISYEALHQDKMMKMLQDKMVNIDADIINHQKKAARNNYSANILPTNLQTSKDETRKLIDEMTSKNQKLHYATVTFAIFADTLEELKKQGKIILVFPSGTRYRPGCPDTKRGLREIDSYLRLFENVLLVGVNGNSLRIDMENPDDMLADIVVQDTITLTASPIINCKEFRNKVLATLPEDTPDPKQVIVDTIMAELDKVHEEGASKR